MLQRTTLPYFSIALLIALASCGGKNPQGMQGPGAVPVTVQEVKTTNATYYDEYPATVTALNQVELRPQVSGYINGIHFKEGSHVRKGEKLYSIDPQQYAAAYSQASANVAALEANMLKARKDLDRYRELDKNDAIAKQQVDNAEAAYEAAKRQVEAAKASVNAVQTNVRYTTITAPFDGTIGISQVRLGAAVSPGQTVLNTISSDDPISVDISVDQKEIYRFTKLFSNQKTSVDSTLRLVFNGEVYPYPGKILAIDRAVNSFTGTILVRMVFPNPDNLLRVGMSGTVRVLNNASEKSIVIPYKAVNEQLGEFFVYLVRSDSNKVTQQRVVLGKQIGRDIIVKDGLKESQTIVVEGIQNLREGSVVAPNTGTPATASASPTQKK